MYSCSHLKEFVILHHLRTDLLRLWMFATCSSLKGVDGFVYTRRGGAVLPSSHLCVQSTDVEQNAAFLKSQRALTRWDTRQRVIPGTRQRDRPDKTNHFRNVSEAPIKKKEQSEDNKGQGRTSGSAHPGSRVGGRSAGPGSTAGCSTPSAAPDQPGYGWVCASPVKWKETNFIVSSFAIWLEVMLI